MKQPFLPLIALALILSGFPAHAEKTAQDGLTDKYKRWLGEEVVYIITPSERSVFLKLKTDRERDLFIEAFWKHRDRDANTAENEHKIEHYRRLNYANSYYGRVSLKPGWQTDRGRIYILLGEPHDIERFTAESEIYNAEVWFYQGLTAYGLPDAFDILFFQKGGVGDYVLYSPVNDGPQALLATNYGDQSSSLTAYNQLKKLEPNLANISLSLIPGESASYGQPLLSSEMLIQNIYDTPKRQFKDRYAEKFLLYKDIVEVEYTANYIDSDSLVAVLKEPSGLYFVNCLLELKKFSIAPERDIYRTQFVIDGNVTDSRGKSIYQFEDTVPLRLTEDELKKVIYNPLDIHYMFPIIPGKYRLSVLLKNEVSKEFTSVEKNIEIPEAESAPRLGPLLLGYKASQDTPGTEKAAKLLPFKFGRQHVYCQPRAIFTTTDKMVLAFQGLGLNPGLRQAGQLKYEILKGEKLAYSAEKKLTDYPDEFNFCEEFPMEKFPPADYKVRVSLLDGSQILSSRDEQFEVTSAANFPRPWVHSRYLSPPDDPVYLLMLGTQFLNAGDKDKARVLLEKVYENPPATFSYALNLAWGFFELADFQKTIHLLSPFIETPEKSYEVLSLLARSHQGLGNYDRALFFYEKALSSFGANVSILNGLGECHEKLGHKDEALAAWEKSLELNPNQPEIKAKIAALKKTDKT